MLNVGKYFHTWSHLIVWVYDQTNPRLPNTLGLEVLGPPKPTQKAKLQQVFGRLAKQMFHQNSLVVYQIYYIDFQPRTLGKMIPLDYYITYIYMICFKCVMKNHQAGNLWKSNDSQVWYLNLLTPWPWPWNSMLQGRVHTKMTNVIFFLYFHPYLGKIPILTIWYVSDGLKPPTSWLVRHVFLEKHLSIVSESIPWNLRTESQRTPASVSCVSCY